MKLLQSVRNGLRGWLRQHGYSLLYSIGNLIRHPLASLMTVLVLGMALVLPLLLWTALQQFQELRQLDGLERISVFIKPAFSADESELQALAGDIQGWSEITRTELISPQAGMLQLREQGGFGDSLDLLQSNPLPWVLSLTPADDRPASVNRLVSRLQQQPWSDAVQADLNWLRRLQSLLDFAGAVVRLLSVLLAIAVLLVVSNTIRLDIQNRQDEIDVLALAGATPAFIRRPFMYTGCLYGLLGALAAWALLVLALLVLQQPLSNIGDAYARDISMRLPAVQDILLMLAGGGLLGLAGARLAVGRRLRLMQPG